MKDSNLKKSVGENDGVNPVAAVVAGAVVVAGVAIAGAMALKDQENRKKVKKALASTKDRVAGYVEEAQKAASEESSEVGEKIAEVKAEVKRSTKKVLAAK